MLAFVFFFFSSRRRHTRFDCDWSSDVCSSDLVACLEEAATEVRRTLRSDRSLQPAEQVRAVLSAYLDHVSANLPEWQALLRGGIGSDPEVSEITEATRRTVWRRMLDDLGASSEEHLLRAALRGWISFVETATLDWAESGA